MIIYFNCSQTRRKGTQKEGGGGGEREREQEWTERGPKTHTHTKKFGAQLPPDPKTPWEKKRETDPKKGG